MAQGNSSARGHQRDEGLGSLMARYLHGDDRAFRQLHACLKPQIKRQIRRKVADSGAVEDLLQQTFLKAHAARARFSSQPARRSLRGDNVAAAKRLEPSQSSPASTPAKNCDFPVKLDGQSQLQLGAARVSILEPRSGDAAPKSPKLSGEMPTNPVPAAVGPSPQRNSAASSMITDSGPGPNTAQAVSDISDFSDFTGFTDRSVAVWYSTIARNATVDYLRKRGRDKTVCWDDPNDEQRGEPALRDPKAEFEGRAVREEERAQLKHDVRNAVGQLPPLQREVVELHRFDGLSIAEISQRTQVHEGTLRVRAHRAYRSLANRLSRPEQATGEAAKAQAKTKAKQKA